jgi:hypothetical protein
MVQVVWSQPGASIELFAQDVGMSGVTGGLGQDMHQHPAQCHVGLRAPWHVPGRVSIKEPDRLVRVSDRIPVRLKDVLAAL